MYLVTGATGQLGRLVIDELLATVAADRVVAAVRSPDKAADLAAKGVVVRHADYDRPETWPAALAGVERVLLISSDAIGVRARQHQAVINTAKAAGVALFAYTSILHADRTDTLLAREHRATEQAILAAGLPGTMLRNGWYTENHLLGLAPALAHGVMVGAAGTGRFSSAARADYAAAAATVLAGEVEPGRVHELAGDSSYTLAEFAAELSRQAGEPVRYQDLSEAEYRQVLLDAGLPSAVAEALANEDWASREDALRNDGGALAQLIERPTTPMPDTIATALARRS